MFSEPSDKAISTHWGEDGDEELYGGEFSSVQERAPCSRRDKKEGLCDQGDGLFRSGLSKSASRNLIQF